MQESQPNPRRKTLRTLIIALGPRLLFALGILISIIYITYLGLVLARGAEFAAALVGAARSTLEYLGKILQGNLGSSAAITAVSRALPIREVLPTILKNSLGLIAAAMLIAIPIGLFLGLRAANQRKSGRSTALILASVIGISLPSFFAALLLQRVVILLTGATGRTILPVGGFGWNTHLILPALVLASRPIAQITRVTFLTISDVLEKEYVRTAHSKGLPARAIRWRHVFRNAAIPILTTIGLSLTFVLGSLPVVEFFFGWPGLGFTLLRSISQQDDVLTVTLILCLGLIFVLVNLLLDLSYRLIDPRIRETPAFIERDRRENLALRFRQFILGLGEALRENPLKRWRAGRAKRDQASPFAAVLEGHEIEEAGEDPGLYAAQRRRAFLRAAFGNITLLMGASLVILLLALLILGPSFAPHNPYTTQGLQFVNGEFIIPPFEPDADYPWGSDMLGRDIMSLIFIGIQQTLYLVVIAVAARMVLGFLLGAVAGWWNESWLDKLIQGAAAIIAAYPNLLLAMIFILAIGIRRGFSPFVIALSLVGWGEIMRLVRSEVITLRAKPFIEGAIATGARVPRIMTAHILPNLVPTLTSLAAIEMGAVLMLLGELGFIGIFIGGGAFAELDIASQPYHYSDVPEWGALLSNVRTYARAYPWTALYPSLSFFIAIVAFNLFGEGLRRVVDRVGVGITRIFNRYTIALALVLLVTVAWAARNSGPLPFYRDQARTFSGRGALAHIRVLSDPALSGRALGTTGVGMAAGYIGEQLDAFGVQEAGEDLTYYQIRERDYQSIDQIPVFRIEDGQSRPEYRQDYVEFVKENRNMGTASGNVRLLALGDLLVTGTFRINIPALEGLDFSDEILLVLSERDEALLEFVPRGGILVVTDDPNLLDRRYTLSPTEPFRTAFGTNRVTGQDAPVIRISEAIGDRLVAGSGYTIAELRRLAEDLEPEEFIELDTGIQASMEITGTIHEDVMTTHVIGHIPGLSASEFGGLNNQMVVVLAQYDSPPPGPEASPDPEAIDNATGVGVMLEIIRVFQETGYQPNRTFLFVAYSGEGYEGGERAVPEIAKFLQTKFGFSEAFDIEAIVDLRGLGGSHGEKLELNAGGSLRLVNLFEEAARQMGVPTERVGEPVDMSVVFDDRSAFDSGQEAPYIALNWENWEEQSRLSQDSLQAVSSDNLEELGRALSLALMVLGREIQY